MFEGDERHQAIKQWIKIRVTNINRSVSAGDVLTRHGVSLRKNGGQEEQISCPFHGPDRHPSARYFPEVNDSLSHVWCFTCHKRWDAISLWKQFNNAEEKFTKILFDIERAYGLETPTFTFDAEVEDEYDPLKDEVERLFEMCENRLREHRRHFNLPGHLKLGSVLDQLRYAMDRGALPLLTVQTHLNQVLAKIGQKVLAPKTETTHR